MNLTNNQKVELSKAFTKFLMGIETNLSEEKSASAEKIKSIYNKITVTESTVRQINHEFEQERDRIKEGMYDEETINKKLAQAYAERDLFLHTLLNSLLNDIKIQINWFQDPAFTTAPLSDGI